MRIKTLLERYLLSAMERMESVIIKDNDGKLYCRYHEDAMEMGYFCKLINVDYLLDGEKINFLQQIQKYPAIEDTFVSLVIDPVGLIEESQNVLKGLIHIFFMEKYGKDVEDFLSFIEENIRDNLNKIIQISTKDIYNDFFSGYLKCRDIEKMEILQAIREFVPSMMKINESQIPSKSLLTKIRNQPCMYFICGDEENEFHEILENMYYIRQYEQILCPGFGEDIAKAEVTVLLDRLPYEPSVVTVIEKLEEKGIHTYLYGQSL